MEITKCMRRLVKNFYENELDKQDSYSFDDIYYDNDTNN